MNNEQLAAKAQHILALAQLTTDLLSADTPYTLGERFDVLAVYQARQISQLTAAISHLHKLTGVATGLPLPELRLPESKTIAEVVDHVVPAAPERTSVVPRELLAFDVQRHELLNMTLTRMYQKRTERQGKAGREHESACSWLQVLSTVQQVHSGLITVPEAFNYLATLAVEAPRLEPDDYCFVQEHRIPKLPEHHHV